MCVFLSRIQITRLPLCPASLKQLPANGWPRVVARNGLHLLDGWPYQFTNTMNVTFASINPDPPQGGLYRYPHGRLRVTLPDGREKFLDIGNVRLTMYRFVAFVLTLSSYWISSILQNDTSHKASYQFYWVWVLLAPEFLHVWRQRDLGRNCL